MYNGDPIEPSAGNLHPSQAEMPSPRRPQARKPDRNLAFWRGLLEMAGETIDGSALFNPFFGSTGPFHV